MSSICFCVVEGLLQAEERMRVFRQFEKIAHRYGRGVTDHIDWTEPILQYLKDDVYVISVNDSQESDNCELLMLPDGWYVNGRTNSVSFQNRVRFFEELAEAALSENDSVSFFIGLSGTSFNEFEDFQVPQFELVEFLVHSVGKNGIGAGLHICVNR